MTRESDMIRYVANSLVRLTEMRLVCAGDQAKEAMREILKKWKENRDDFRAFDEIVNKFDKLEAIDDRQKTFNEFKNDLIDLEAFLNKTNSRSIEETTTRESDMIRYVMNSVLSLTEMRHVCAGDQAKEAMREILTKWKENRYDFRAFDEIVDKFDKLEAIDDRQTTFNDFKHALIDLEAFLNK